MVCQVMDELTKRYHRERRVMRQHTIPELHDRRDALTYWTDEPIGRIYGTSEAAHEERRIDILRLAWTHAELSRRRSYMTLRGNWIDPNNPPKMWFG